MRYLILLVLGLLAAAAGAQTLPAADARPALLKALDGHWRMTGDVRGKPVEYDMTAAPTLQAGFTEMHMKDMQVPAKYEARVFIGYDEKSAALIVHWLDTFGARYSIPHATGTINGDVAEFTFPYPDGRFRDTLTRDAASDSWRFVIEAAQPDGSWKHFARYDIRKK